MKRHSKTPGEFGSHGSITQPVFMERRSVFPFPLQLLSLGMVEVSCVERRIDRGSDRHDKSL